MTRDDLAIEIRGAFRNPRELCALLGLDAGATRQAGNGVSIRCPSHAERTPSCSVTNGPDGSVRFRCFGCGATGSALDLVAAARGLDVRSQFRVVLETAAEIGGLWAELAELRGEGGDVDRQVVAKRPHIPLPPERTYPDGDALQALWDASTAVYDDRDATQEVESRGLDAGDVANADLARVIPSDRLLPAWARYQGRTWNATGHRMIVRAFDSWGRFRSVRAWRVVDGDSPKRLPPGGHKASELVLASGRGVEMLAGRLTLYSVIICEGEPDTLVRSIVNRDTPVLGVGSGSWTQGFADRIPYGAEVFVRTHRDRAGDAYADKILDTLRTRAIVHRLVAENTEAA